MELGFLKKEEKIAVNLKSLYKRYGYNSYKLASFEEYSLYNEYVDFLTSGNVVTFSANGKLLALRPDVTLSILKNIKIEDGETKKIFYDEKVYRTPMGGKNLKEVSQIGVEIIGEADEVSEAELLCLAYKTLQAIGVDFTLEVADMRIISAIISDLNLDTDGQNQVVKFLQSKNIHAFKTFASKNGCSKSATEAFINLIKAEGDAFEVLNEIATFSRNSKVVATAKNLIKILSLIKEYVKVSIDFSIVNNSAYYNGIIFKGYVLGVPNFVLTGGRYDKLAQNLGKSVCAVGFALYLGELSSYLSEGTVHPDVAIIYNENSAKNAIIKANEIRESGLSVQLSKNVSKNFKGKIIYAEEDV